MKKLTPEEMLMEVFNPSSQDCTTPEQDLQLGITLNPDLDKIIQAMKRYAEQDQWIDVNEYKAVILQLLNTFVIDLDAEGVPKPTITEIMKLIDRATLLITPTK
jgi:hypothetical protein